VLLPLPLLLLQPSSRRVARERFASWYCLPRLPPALLQVTKYVEREIINHRQLVHPHIIQFKEVGAYRCRRCAS